MLSLGSSAQLGIGIQIMLQDKFSGTASTVARNLKSLKNSASESVTSAMRSYRNNAAGIAAAATAASLAIGSMVEDSAEFQHRINQVAIVGGAQLKTTRAELTKFAQDMSQVYGKSPTEIASALYENAKAGITTNIQEITKYQLAVATAVGEQLEGPGGVAEKLIGIMNAYDMPTKRFGDIANAMTSVANATISNVNDIGQAMEYAAFTAKNFNIPFEMTLAMVGKLSQAKIQGSSAGTGINNMLLQLAKSLGPIASPKSKKVWAMLGLNLDEMRKMMNAGNIAGVVQSLSMATAKMTPVMRTALLSDLFQRRGDRALEGIFGTQNGVSLDQLYKGAIGDEKRNISQKQAAQSMNDLAGSLKQLNNAWIVFKQTLVVGITPGLRLFFGVLKGVIRVMTYVAATPIGKVLFGLAAVIVPLIGIMFAFQAAALTAAIALNGFALTTRLGGFRALLGAGINNLVGNSGGLRAGMQMNSAGRPFVGAGQSVNFGGKTFGPGQFLPMAAMSAAQTAGTLGKIASGVIKFAGVVGAIITIASIAEAIYSWLRGSHEDVVRRAQIDNSFSTPGTSKRFGDSYVSNARTGNWIPSQEQQNSVLKQTINLNVDGKQVMTQQIDQKMSDDMDSQMNFNTINH